MGHTVSARHPRLLLPALGASYFLFGTASLAVIGLLEAMASAWQVTPARIAELVAVHSLTFAVAAPLLQILFGHRPRRELISGGLLLLGLGALATAMAPDWSAGLAARVLMALGAAAIGPAASAQGAAVVEPTRQSGALATIFAGMTLAIVLGTPLAAWLGHVGSWRTVFVLLAISAPLLGIALWRAIGCGTAGPRIAGSGFLRVLERPATAWALLMMLLLMAGQFCAYTLLVPLMTKRFGLAAGDMTALLMLFGLGGVIGNLLAGRFGSRLGPVRLIRLSVLGLTIAFSGLMLAPALPMPGVLLMMLWSVCGLLFAAPQQQRLIQLAPPALRSLALAANASAMYLGMSLGAWSGARLYELAGVETLIPASLLLTLLGTLALQRSRQAQREDERLMRSGIGTGTGSGTGSVPKVWVQ
jgi:DHA1 family inner membrane transport protein